MRRNVANPSDHLGELMGAEPTSRCGDLRVDFMAREANQINFRATLHARVEARAHGRHPFSDAMCTARAQRGLQRREQAEGSGDFSILDVKFCRNGAQQIAPRKARNE